MRAKDLDNDPDDASSEGGSVSTASTSEAEEPAKPSRKLAKRTLKRPAGSTEIKQNTDAATSAAPFERQVGALCLMHSLNNILYACCSQKVATPQTFHAAASELSTEERNIVNSPAQYANDRGILVCVANRWLETHIPCCRVQHSLSGEVGDGERVIGALVQPRGSGHFVCHRKPYDLRRWHRVDSQSSRPVPLTDADALAPHDLRYFVLHQSHECTSLVDDHIRNDASVPEAAAPAAASASSTSDRSGAAPAPTVPEAAAPAAAAADHSGAASAASVNPQPPAGPFQQFLDASRKRARDDDSKQ